jgi:hypothetical protein
MRLIYFVKDDCDACKNAKDKVEFFLGKWGVADTIERESISVSTEDGLVEAAMQEVGDIPTILLKDGDREVGRWTKKAPPSDSLKALLGV